MAEKKNVHDHEAEKHEFLSPEPSVNTELNSKSSLPASANNSPKAKKDSLTDTIDRALQAKKEFLTKLWNLFVKEYSPIYKKEDIAFEDVAKFLQSSSTTQVFAKLWKLLRALVDGEAYDKQIHAKDRHASRMVLATLMIYHFPSDMLDEPDIKDFQSPLCEQVYSAATDVITLLINKTDLKDKPDDAFKNLHTLINGFLADFQAWKKKDIHKLMDTLKNVYTEWAKSERVMNITALHDIKKDKVLETIINSKNTVKKKIIKLVGEKDGMEICNKIDEEVKNEPEIIRIENESANKKIGKASPKNNNNNNDNEEKKEDVPETMEQKLAKKGVPVNIKTGRNLVKELPKNERKQEKNDDDDEVNKYVEDYKGQKVLNLDKIIAEVSAKKYWDDFAEQIENNNYKRLFELLSELLERLKKISPKKDRKHLDDLIDVKFIQQTIDNNVLDAKGFYGIFLGIHRQIKSIHAPVYDKPWDSWHDQVVAEMYKKDASWSKLLPQVLNTFLMKLDQIEDQVNAIKSVQQKKKQEKESKN